MRDVKEDPDPGEQHHERRAAVREERERDPGQRRDPHHGRDVDRRLSGDEHRQPGREALSEGVLAAECDVEAGQALGGILSNAHYPPQGSGEPFDQFAARVTDTAYRIAEAMVRQGRRLKNETYAAR